MAFTYCYKSDKIMVKYEYYYLNDVREKNVKTKLNELGEQGWELVNFTQHFGWGNTCNFVLKRIKQ